jgi:hypothetical protein
MDANFRLKNQLVSNYSQDPGLGIGWAYMLPRGAYEAYILSQTDDTDVGVLHNFFANLTYIIHRSAHVLDSRHWLKQTPNSQEVYGIQVSVGHFVGVPRWYCQLVWVISRKGSGTFDYICRLF